MAGYKLIQSVGVSSEITYLWVPNVQRANTIPVILSHGATAPDNFAKISWPKTSALVAAIASAGIPCIAHYQNGDKWANDTVMSRIDGMLAYVSSKTGCRSDKSHQFGISMGGGAAIRYTALNVDKVASLCANIPMSNMTAMYTNDLPAGARAGIGTAWGVTYPTALPAGTNLPGLAVNIKSAGIPSIFNYSTIDAYIVPSDVQTIATAAGGTAVAIDNTYGHADGTIGNVDVNDYIKFLVANGS